METITPRTPHQETNLDEVNLHETKLHEVNIREGNIHEADLLHQDDPIQNEETAKLAGLSHPIAPEERIYNLVDGDSVVERLTPVDLEKDDSNKANLDNHEVTALNADAVELAGPTLPAATEGPSDLQDPSEAVNFSVDQPSQNLPEKNTSDRFERLEAKYNKLVSVLKELGNISKYVESHLDEDPIPPPPDSPCYAPSNYSSSRSSSSVSGSSDAQDDPPDSPDPELAIRRIGPVEFQEIRGQKEKDPEADRIPLAVLAVFPESLNHISGEINVKEKAIQSQISEKACDPETFEANTKSDPASRLRIESQKLWDWLMGIFVSDSARDFRPVMLSPFKHFVVHHKEIRQKLSELEAEVETKRSQLNFETVSEKAPPEEADASFAASKNQGSSLEEPIPSQDPVEEAADPKEDNTDANSEDDEARDELKSSIRLRDEARLLINFMDNEMKHIFAIRDRIADLSIDRIAFPDLWHLFKPGELVFAEGEFIQAYRVLHVTGGRRKLLNVSGKQPLVGLSELEDTGHEAFNGRRYKETEATDADFEGSNRSLFTPLKIDCFSLDFDGQKFGPIPKVFNIQPYSGERPIQKLEAYPAKLAKDEKTMREALVTRGQKFVTAVGIDHFTYSGVSHPETRVQSYREEIDSDVMTDVCQAMKYFTNREREDDDEEWNIELGGGVLDDPSECDNKEFQEYKACGTASCTHSGCRFLDIVDDSEVDKNLRANFLANTNLHERRALNKEASFSDEYYELMPPRVYGYALLNRKWLSFSLDKLHFIDTTSRDGFDDLVLPDGHKDIMQALVRTHSRSSRTGSLSGRVDADFSTDLVRGKGKGLIILLHGVPGVGKTSTAECIAEQTRRPLLRITCGDLGMTAKDVEKTLSDYFDLAERWKCVLLLDEADVFLASRDQWGDLNRNSLVSVFLRVLEYYSGILILTTNRVGSFDEAFRSRIHISLSYPRLDKKSTMKIWEMNMKRTTERKVKIDMDEKDIREFAKEQWKESVSRPGRRWNGRQIKNAFQTAIALAHFEFDEAKATQKTSLERPMLIRRHFTTVSKASNEFDDYLSRIWVTEHEDTYEVLAAQRQLRASESPAQSRRNRSSLLKTPRTGRKRSEDEKRKSDSKRKKSSRKDSSTADEEEEEEKSEDSSSSE